jgi:phthiocerol/phenolphthiocerol synthesis type-I polyketide synthase E
MSFTPSPCSVEEHILQGLVDWCRSQGHGEELCAETPFSRLNPDWMRRFALREALVAWIRENTGLATFYPDELDVASTPRTLARHLARRMVSGTESPVRPPIIPFSSDKVKEPTVFVLGCPRSGTTIFRCMLMGHPDIYAGPELHMMQFESLLQRERRIVDTGESWMVMGFSQTIQDLTGWSEREAFHYVSTLTKRDLPINDVYRIIHRYSKKPIVVDKSPSLPRASSNLERIESRFSNARYLYITRHPYAVIESMLRLEARPFQGVKSITAAENIWLDTNTTIRAFLEGIPESRQHQLSYEDLMRTTEQNLRGVTDFLGVAYDPAMADPYKGNRLVKGLGCVNLPKRTGVERELGEAWKRIRLPRKLSASTRALAAQLGYKV